MLEHVGVWQQIPSRPIERILVSQAGGFGRARLDAQDAGVPSLGHVAEYSDVVAALRAAAAELMGAEIPPS